MPDSWYLVKQLASDLSLELIEDGAISHFTSLSLLYDSQHAHTPPSLARHLLLDEYRG
jgi:hypothetical protein